MKLPMHAAALLTAMVTHGLIIPPVEKQQMDQLLRAEHAGVVVNTLIKINRGISALKSTRGSLDPEKKNGIPWAEDEYFKSLFPEKFGWAGIIFSVPPSTTTLKLDIIDCKTDERAKEIFLQLRLRRIPDYARSGRFLIKTNNEETFEWFRQYFGAERYSVRRTPFIW